MPVSPAWSLPRLVPDGLTVAWSTDFADAGVRSSRPAARSLASWSAFTRRAMSSKGFGLAVVALDAASRPCLAFCRPAGWVPWALDLPAGFLGVLAGVVVGAVCRGLAMLGTPMPADRAGLSSAIAVGDHGQPTTPLACRGCPFNGLCCVWSAHGRLTSCPIQDQIAKASSSNATAIR